MMQGGQQSGPVCCLLNDQSGGNDCSPQFPSQDTSGKQSGLVNVQV